MAHAAPHYRVIIGELRFEADLFFDECTDSYDAGTAALALCCLNAQNYCNAECINDQGGAGCQSSCDTRASACHDDTTVVTVSSAEPGFHEEPISPLTSSQFRLDYCFRPGADCGGPAAHKFCEMTHGPG